MPPYPEPMLRMVFSSGKCMMNLFSGSRSPVECIPLTNPPSLSILDSASSPILVIKYMLATTYGLSVISTPHLESSEPIGPMQYGMTYMVLPSMQFSNKSSSFSCASLGSIQLLFGPASAASSVQIKVKCSTLATSDGSDLCK